MKWTNLHLAGLGSWLGPRVPVAEAVAAGHLTAERAVARGYDAVCVAEDVAPPDMAVRAAQSALAQAGTDERDTAVLLHASTWFQGRDVWATASYVAARSVGRTVPALDVQQRCNGGLLAWELAGAHLQAGLARGGSAVVTTADRFAAPELDRWNLHDTNVYGDGGTAVVLSRRRGFARVLSSVTVADNSLEAVTRGEAPLARSSREDTPPDLRERGRWSGELDRTQAELRTARVFSTARNAALADARVRLGDLRRIVVGATGLFDGGYHHHHLLGVPADVTTWEFGRTTGHVGTGDWAAGLEWLLRSGALDPGDHVMLFGGGAGFSCTAVVLQVEAVPTW
ncbi:ketoacyl-ACP synthase III family protein [Kineococcus sp. NPDC059986]|uniref:ketoacyl-ACP synthase III family protein n=1 Tax=Kineococcus sp. NPDC059986 TaxID=3155538 RepID=UPI00344C1B0C